MRLDGRIKKILAILFLSLSVANSVSSLTYSRGPVTTRVLLITIDALRPDHLSCYGYKKNTSPNIDRVAKKGILFTQVISQSSFTSSALSSLMTSVYPIIHRVYDHGEPIPASLPKLAEVLKAKGFSTAAFNGRDVRDTHNIELGFDKFVYCVDDEAVTSQAIKWLEENAEKRFFLWLHYFGPHSPYRPSGHYEVMYLPDKVKEMGREGDKPIYKILKALTKDDIIEYHISQYDGEIRYTDEQIGKLLNWLEETSQYKDNTLIIISADHGEALGEHDHYFAHATSLYDEQIRIPLIIQYKRAIPEDKKITMQVQAIDIVPTILDILAIEKPGVMQGVSLLPLIRDENKNKYISKYAFRYTFSEVYKWSKWIQRTPHYFAIRTPDWKLICTKYIDGEKGYELYNLKTDPRELVNVIKKEKRIFKFLYQKLSRYINQKPFQNVKSNRYLDADTEEMLRSLGYLQ